MTRSLVSYDEGYRDGIREGVRWSVAVLQRMFDALPVTPEKQDERYALVEAINKLQAAPVDGPLMMPGAR